jgi:hypothetical protein
VSETSVMKVVTVCFSETSVSSWKSARRYNQKTNIDIFIAVRTSDLKNNLYCWRFGYSFQWKWRLSSGLWRHIDSQVEKVFLINILSLSSGLKMETIYLRVDTPSQHWISPTWRLAYVSNEFIFLHFRALQWNTLIYIFWIQCITTDKSVFIRKPSKRSTV